MKFEKDIYGNYSLDYCDDYIGTIIDGYDPHMRYEILIKKLKGGGYGYILTDKNNGSIYDSYLQTNEIFKKVIDASFEAGRHIARREIQHAGKRTNFLLQKEDEYRKKQVILNKTKGIVTEKKDLLKIVKNLLEVIPKEENETILKLNDILLLPEQYPLSEENIYDVIFSCLPYNIENDLKEWQKKVIQIWTSK